MRPRQPVTQFRLRESAGGKSRSVRVGETINGLLVAEVKPDRVRLTMGEDSEELLLKVAAGPRTTVQPVQPVAAGGPGAPGAPVAGQPGGPAMGGGPAAAAPGTTAPATGAPGEPKTHPQKSNADPGRGSASFGRTVTEMRRVSPRPRPTVRHRRVPFRPWNHSVVRVSGLRRLRWNHVPTLRRADADRRPVAMPSQA